SRVELSAHTRVTVEEQTPGTLRLRLEHGSIVCDVAPDPSRQFLVHAAGATVRVTGTRFRVEVTRAESKSGKLEQQVRVNVTRGSVEVQGADTKAPPRMLTAGDSLALKPESDVHPKPRTAKEPATPTVEMGDLPNAA